MEPLPPRPPQQSQTKSQQERQELNSIRRAAQNGLGERNGQKTSRDAADKQTTPRGSLSAFTVMAKEQSPEPENGKHGSCAGHCRGQTASSVCPKMEMASYEIDSRPLRALLARPGEHPVRSPLRQSRVREEDWADGESAGYQRPPPTRTEQPLSPMLQNGVTDADPPIAQCMETVQRKTFADSCSTPCAVCRHKRGPA